MSDTDDIIDSGDPFNLNRFTKAQESVYDRAMAELAGGQKRSHWMWFIFPQIEGLGHSSISRQYAIKSIEEAREYLKHPLLGARLSDCAEAVLGIDGRSASEVFGFPDDLKLRSSMTLFATISERGSAFALVLDKFFNGDQDERTLQLLRGEQGE
ncbi:MAG: DUF1810 domain-containing protein [Phycisphaerae bacterium]|jgi:uncharacterized protein (DUF1810 family)|nr:DUF1810 domain-containing protein [Phycisphaerae bacterium]